MSLAPPYPYPVNNSELIANHGLEKHFEGGYFAQTALLDSVLPTSPKSANPHVPESGSLEGREQIAFGTATELLSPTSGVETVPGSQQRTDASQIFYLLTPESYRGRMHMNLHSIPTIHRVILGSNPSQGEVLQLFVPGGWWKASEIPDEDLILLDAPDAEGANLKEKIGCLISEIVVPGWNPDQHQFIDEDKLKAMWRGKSGWEQYTKYIQAPDGLEYPDK
ncbi:uncharacterized protein L201_007359 [Kwoniella dendrophila CBS 6074]|uniref:DUF985 domain-containing protein n=1 Tax=Kwoniella dendrophila CBS 6074 TaxID=1295534 RepID=A0AAX4K465_9TREE